MSATHLPAMPMPPIPDLPSSGFRLTKGKVLKLANSMLALYECFVSR